MAATGYTPVYLYYSSTATNAPAAGNLGYGELAINITDGYLFYKDNANAVQKIGYKLVPVTAGGTGLTAVTKGYIPFGNTATSLATSASGLFWDETNVRLGIYNTAPATALDVYGTIRATRRGATSQYVDLLATSGGTSLNVSAGSGALNISTNGGTTNMLAVDGVGNVTVGAGNLVIGTSGKGIDFSATAGTGTSELLADYEEGTWTPALKFGGASVGMTGTFTGRYTKVGRLVYAYADITLTAKGSSTGNNSITGLPYTSADASTGIVDPTANMAGLTAGGAIPMGISATTCYMFVQVAGGRNLLTDANFTNTSVFRFSLCYEV